MVGKAEAPLLSTQFPCSHTLTNRDVREQPQVAASTSAQKGKYASVHRRCREDAQCSLLCLRNKSSDSFGENVPLWPDKLKYVVAYKVCYIQSMTAYKE